MGSDNENEMPKSKGKRDPPALVANEMIVTNDENKQKSDPVGTTAEESVPNWSQEESTAESEQEQSNQKTASEKNIQKTAHQQSMENSTQMQSMQKTAQEQSKVRSGGRTSKRKASEMKNQVKEKATPAATRRSSRTAGSAGNEGSQKDAHNGVNKRARRNNGRAGNKKEKSLDIADRIQSLLPKEKNEKERILAEIEKALISGLWLKPTSTDELEGVKTPGEFSGGNDVGTSTAVQNASQSKCLYPTLKVPFRELQQGNQARDTTQDVVSVLLEMPPVPVSAPSNYFQPLAPNEMKFLEFVLEITPEDGWRGDWSGNLLLVDKEVLNPKRSRNTNVTNGIRQPLLAWSKKNNSLALRSVQLLVRHVVNMKGIPDMAKRILSHSNNADILALEQAVRRVSFDPVVLEQDGWITKRSSEPMGATGGPYCIGDKLNWQGFGGVVIAYVHDPDLGDLWRGLWLEEGLETFDMEAEELLDALKKHGKVEATKVPSSNVTAESSVPVNLSRRSNRHAATSEFRIPGVEYGIVLAASTCRGARPGVYWPARVMHASETGESSSSNSKHKRSAPRMRLDVIFLAPYWNSLVGNNGSTAVSSMRRKESFSESLSRHGEILFSSGPLFQYESIDVSEETMKAYPIPSHPNELDVAQLQVAFRFTGLPKAAFARFLDSHRLALALRKFSKDRLRVRASVSDQAIAGLFETHPMSVLAPRFPTEVLHLPYQYILSQLPPVSSYSDSSVVHDVDDKHMEHILRITSIIEAMKPPNSWGKTTIVGESVPLDTSISSARHEESPSQPSATVDKKSPNGVENLELERFLSDMPLLHNLLVGESSSPAKGFLEGFRHVLASLSTVQGSGDMTKGERQARSQEITNEWIVVKTYGEDAVGMTNGFDSTVVSEWRRLSERIYKKITQAFSGVGFGDGVSTVITDSRCNHHITSNGCYERPVRLPAALKAAKQLGAGKHADCPIIHLVDDRYLDLVSNKVLMKAHSTSYLRRMKQRCEETPNNKVVPLTEDSEGRGGEDTQGSRGTWTAAVSSVAAAVMAVDMVVKGECVNAFCITRPPGHHAGRNLHPMKAVSNGFCILNTAACAALHATTSVSQGGAGLKRVCIIDFDVHHGNGTQDILCSTFDPRFLYVSLHAGGAHVNGVSDDALESQLYSPGGSSNLKGIYPGRCGDSSPHKGVLNIPLGAKVTPHAVGSALISQVTPAVDAFAPDIIILSTGFDAHKNDPLGLGGLSADDFGHITEVACQIAFKSCSGRLVSILEGGYGVPCCRPQDPFLPVAAKSNDELGASARGQDVNNSTEEQKPSTQQAIQRPQPSKLLDLGEELPDDMEDQVPFALQRRLEKCHLEGFMECTKEHLRSLRNCNKRGRSSK